MDIVIDEQIDKVKDKWLDKMIYKQINGVIDRQRTK